MAFLRSLRAIRWFALVAIALALLPIPAAALDPQLDAACWPSTMRTYCEEEARGHFESARRDCGQGWFHCYPGQRIPIRVRLLGQSDVSGIAEYLSLAYRLAIAVAGIAAVVVIMAAGVVWIVSGGADRKTVARQWIGNAVIGLVLVLGSYVILQTVNPDLVRLSLPRFAILRPVALATKFCGDLPVDVPILTRDNRAVVPDDRAKLQCGHQYQTPTALTRQCIGNACAAANEVCVPLGPATFRCAEGTIGGEASGDGQAYVDGKVALVVVCANGDRIEIPPRAKVETVVERRRQRFTFAKQPSALDEVARVCRVQSSLNWSANLPEVRGFYLEVDVNDGGGVDDYFAIGNEGCRGSPKPIMGPGGVTDPSNIAWAQVPDAALLPEVQVYAALRSENPRAFRCNLSINRGEFRAR